MPVAKGHIPSAAAKELIVAVGRAFAADTALVVVGNMPFVGIQIVVGEDQVAPNQGVQRVLFVAAVDGLHPPSHYHPDYPKIVSH